MATDFFDRQQQARRRTRAMAVLLAGTVVGTLLALAVVATVAANIVDWWMDDDRVERRERERERAAIFLRDAEALDEVAQKTGMPRPNLGAVHVPEPLPPWRWTWWWPGLWAGVFTVGGLFMLASGLQKRSELAGGGYRVALVLGGRPADPRAEAPAAGASLSERQLVNVVEEMTIAAGLPVPRVYVLPRERGINAFAAGRTPEEACIVVTAGALRYLTRDELQAVIAHECSHILNGDLQLNHNMILAVFAVGGLGMIGTGFLRTLTTESEGEGVVLLAHPVGWIFGAGAVVLATLGGIGMGAARLLQAAVNRQREFLADASAIQFTRNPGALAGALKKIGGLRRQGRLLNLHAAEIAHLCIAAPGFQVLATHPALADRVRRIEPGFDGAFQRIEQEDEEVSRRLRATEERVRRERAQERRQAAALGRARDVLAGDLLLAAGTLPAGAESAAHALLDELPPELREAAHDPAGAQALVLGLVPARDAEARRRQFEAAGEIEVAVAARADRLREPLGQLAPEHRLPLLDLALPALQALEPYEKRRLLELLSAAVRADDHLSLEEFCFYKIIEHALVPDPTRRRPTHSIAAVSRPAGVLMAGLACLDPDPPVAYGVGIERLKLSAPPAAFAPPSVSAFEAALDDLASASPAVLRRVLDAAAFCVAADGAVSPREHETLRAVAAVLHVPLPPRLASALQPA